MDALTTVVGELRFDTVGYRRLECAAGTDLDFSQDGLRGVHAVLDGRCVLRTADGTSPLSEGDVVVLPRGDPHALHMPVACTILCGAFLVGESEHPVLAALPHVVTVSRSESPGVGAVVDALVAEAGESAAGGPVVQARLSDALVVQALRHYATTSEATGWLAALRDPAIARVLLAVHDAPGRPWDVATLAATAGLSRTVFCARFVALLQQPPMRYVTAIRVQRARTLLRDENLTVAAVASRLGYGSESAFAAAFKRETGVSPGSLRTDRAEVPAATATTGTSATG
ncbi:AraC family transcriptional regulator [Gordonia sp. CPCC 205515]|uniref:helix-turn-helix transcriptional regulator n=1 Tax=Gordonia sp. CPCC 205515 TaxID=3140791 RepID=UPI003AF3E44B